MIAVTALLATSMADDWLSRRSLLHGCCAVLCCGVPVLVLRRPFCISPTSLTARCLPPFRAVVFGDGSTWELLVPPIGLQTPEIPSTLNQEVLSSLVRRGTDAIEIGLNTRYFLTLETSFCTFLNKPYRKAMKQSLKDDPNPKHRTGGEIRVVLKAVSRVVLLLSLIHI